MIYKYNTHKFIFQIFYQLFLNFFFHLRLLLPWIFFSFARVWQIPLMRNNLLLWRVNRSSCMTNFINGCAKQLMYPMCHLWSEIIFLVYDRICETIVQDSEFLWWTKSFTPCAKPFSGWTDHSSLWYYKSCETKIPVFLQ